MMFQRKQKMSLNVGTGDIQTDIPQTIDLEPIIIRYHLL